MTLEVEVVPFDGTLSRSEFDCGNEPLNTWLRTQSSQNEVRGISRTKVTIPKRGMLSDWQKEGFFGVGEGSILGYFTLSSAQVPLEHLPVKNLPRFVPAIRMGRLAVDKSLQGRGFGQVLLMEALAQAASVSDSVGVAGMFVDAKDSRAAGFYAKYGFTAAEDDPLKLWLPLKSLLHFSPG